MKCRNCDKDFDVDKEPGGLMIGPPVSHHEGKYLHRKIHLCRSCWDGAEIKVDNSDLIGELDEPSALEELGLEKSDFKGL